MATVRPPDVGATLTPHNIINIATAE